MNRIRVSKRHSSFQLAVDVVLSRRVTGLFGPSGSGKSMLLNCVAGLVRPDEGHINVGDHALFDGAEAVDVPVRARRIGYVFQDALLFEHLTVEGNLRYSRRNRDGSDFDRVVEVLELKALLRRRAADVSGGEKRRVALGRALLSAPDLLLLDEPLTGLDRRLAGKTLAFIHRVLGEFDTPAIYVSHSIGDVVFLCEDVIILDHGRVRAQGEPGTLIAEMEEVETPHHAGLKNIFTVPVQKCDPARGTVTCALGAQDLVVAARAPEHARSVTVVAAARDLVLSIEWPVGLSARNVLSATVVAVQHLSDHCVVFVDVGARWMVEVTRDAADDLKLVAGMTLFVIVKASTLHCVYWH